MVSRSRVTLLCSHDHILQSCANFLQFSLFNVAGHHAKLDSSSSVSSASSSLSLSSILICTRDFCPPRSLDVKSNYFILKVDSAEEDDRKRKLSRGNVSRLTPPRPSSVIFCPENIGLKLRPLAAKKTERNLIVAKNNVYPTDPTEVIGHYYRRSPTGGWMCGLIGAFFRWL